MADTAELQASTASHSGGGIEDEESLTPLEQEVLDEYARLLGTSTSSITSHPLLLSHHIRFFCHITSTSSITSYIHHLYHIISCITCES